MGRAPRQISSPFLNCRNQTSACWICLLRLAWVSMQPLETPVVPPVYWYMATSSKPIFGRGGLGLYLAMQSFHLYTSGAGFTSAAIFFFLATSGNSRLFGKGR